MDINSNKFLKFTNINRKGVFMYQIRDTIMKRLGMLNESVYDKLKFKAVFLAGGPGVGKSFILSKAFPEATVSSDSGGNEIYQSGGKWKVINSDHLFTHSLLKVDLPLEIAGSDDPVMFGLQQNIRNISKSKLAIRNIPWLNSMLPIIIDGTCKNGKETISIKNKLESIGYDVYMLFIDADEDVASQRNASRNRKVDDRFVRKTNRMVKENKELFMREFGDKFKYINNSTNWKENPQLLDALKKELKKFGNMVENPQIQNKIGQKIVSTLEKMGGAYLSDYFAAGENKGKSGGKMTSLSSDEGPNLDIKKGVDI
jgi:hypothetical protein